MDHTAQPQKRKQPDLKMSRTERKCRWPTVNEEMPNIANYQGNSNQNHNEISPPTCQNSYHQKEHK